MTLDARYDQERHLCACGCGYFVVLTVVQVHTQLGRRDFALLPPLDPQHPEAQERLPIAECVQCRTRYNARWQEVV